MPQRCASSTSLVTELRKAANSKKPKQSRKKVLFSSLIKLQVASARLKRLLREISWEKCSFLDNNVAF